MFLTTTYSSNYIMDRSPLESRVGELRIVPRPQHIEVDINESRPSHFSIGVWLDMSYFTQNVCDAWGTLGGTYQIQDFELCMRCPGVSRHEFIGRECRPSTPGSIVNFQGKTTRKGKHICASFTVDIPPSLHPRYAEECTYELIASVKILTTDAMGMESTIVRTGYAEIDISSKHVPLFINPLTPSGHGTSIFTLL
ncbi:hypothetical protein RHS04_09606 [Rhizoctonia solani]|uniref:Uncharacterized protein n=1 Tax=Rhizoctonia solani TaxID=456999 RepID=A0A8H7H0N2_9AGAM|nr:hypothetical protein RHS04_09606 [Rhizoctonia solani]